MFRSCLSCHFARHPPGLLQRLGSVASISRIGPCCSVATDSSVIHSSMDKAPDSTEQTPHETTDMASEGAPETFEVFQTPDLKSSPEAGKCNPLTDPHCAHDDKLPAVTGPRGYNSTEDS